MTKANPRNLFNNLSEKASSSPTQPGSSSSAGFTSNTVVRDSSVSSEVSNSDGG